VMQEMAETTSKFSSFQWATQDAITRLNERFQQASSASRQQPPPLASAALSCGRTVQLESKLGNQLEPEVAQARRHTLARARVCCLVAVSLFSLGFFRLSCRRRAQPKLADVHSVPFPVLAPAREAAPVSAPLSHEASVLVRELSASALGRRAPSAVRERSEARAPSAARERDAYAPSAAAERKPLSESESARGARNAAQRSRGVAW
jgi:hypothetical protein